MAQDQDLSSYLLENDQCCVTTVDGRTVRDMQDFVCSCSVLKILSW